VVRNRLGVGALLCLVAVGAGTAYGGMIGVDVDQFAVLAGGKISTGKDVTIEGTIGAVKNISLGKQSTVFGDIYTTHKLDAGSSVTVFGDILASKNVHLGKDSWFGGDVVGAGRLDLSSGVTVMGDVATENRLSLGKDSLVHGDALYGTSYSLGSGAVVEGLITQLAEDLDEWSPTLRSDPGLSTSVSENDYFAANSVFTLDPGDYGRLDIDRDSVLYLSAGTYNFQKIWLGQDVRLVADTSAGDVIINIVDKLDTGSGVTFERLGTGLLTFQAGGNVHLGQDIDADASFLSFAGKIDVASNGSIEGFLYAQKNISLGQGVSVGGAAVPEPATVLLLAMAVPVLIVSSPSVSRRW